MAVNQFAVKYLRCPFDIQNHQMYDQYSNNLVEANRKVAASQGIDLGRLLGATLWDVTTFAIREEISYRFLLETIVLPRISPQFVTFSVARTGICSLLFDTQHLTNNHAQQLLTVQFFNTFLLGIVCSLAQQKIGLIGSIFIHMRYNLHAWQYMYNQDLTKALKKITAIHLIDTIHPIKFATFVAQFISDIVVPFALAYRVIHQCSRYVTTTIKIPDKDLIPN